MRILRRPVFLLSFTVFLVEQLLESSGIYLPFIHAYADDICCMPVILSLASAAMSMVYFGKQRWQFTYVLSPFQILLALAYCIVLFEVLLPRYSAKYVADVWDIPAYALGTFVFILFNKTKAPERKVDIK